MLVGLAVTQAKCHCCTRHLYGERDHAASSRGGDGCWCIHESGSGELHPKHGARLEKWILGSLSTWGICYYERCLMRFKMLKMRFGAQLKKGEDSQSCLEISRQIQQFDSRKQQGRVMRDSSSRTWKHTKTHCQVCATKNLNFGELAAQNLRSGSCPSIPRFYLSCGLFCCGGAIPCFLEQRLHRTLQEDSHSPCLFHTIPYSVFLVNVYSCHVQPHFSIAYPYFTKNLFLQRLSPPRWSLASSLRRTPWPRSSSAASSPPRCSARPTPRQAPHRPGRQNESRSSRGSCSATRKMKRLPFLGWFLEGVCFLLNDVLVGLRLLRYLLEVFEDDWESGWFTRIWVMFLLWW